MIDFGNEDPGAMNGGTNGSILGNAVGEWICKRFPSKTFAVIGMLITWILGWIAAGIFIRIGFDVYDYLAKLIQEV